MNLYDDFIDFCEWHGYTFPCTFEQLYASADWFVRQPGFEPDLYGIMSCPGYTEDCIAEIIRQSRSAWINESL